MDDFDGVAFLLFTISATTQLNFVLLEEHFTEWHWKICFLGSGDNTCLVALGERQFETHDEVRCIFPSLIPLLSAVQ